MEWWPLIRKDLLVLLLLSIANSAPILARLILKDRFSLPLDLGVKWIDGRPIFGSHKTIRGVISSIVCTALFARLIGFSLVTGVLLSVISMFSDLLSSFIKRRCGLKSGAKATGLDQIPEALIPLIILKDGLLLTYYDIVAIVTLFFLVEVLLSPLLYVLKIRRAPH